MNLTLKWSVRVLENLVAVLCLWRNMAICKRDWHFKLQDKNKYNLINRLLN